ncbi:MAG: hypothetical protein IJH53_03040 [Oscillospiraceae bacterium]|nr:hypothetical protein [Oscillospiraceae bacterium]
MIRIIREDKHSWYGDVYVSDWLAGVMVNDRELGGNVLKAVERFRADDFGLICGFDKMHTNDWYFGGDFIGRYSVGKWNKGAQINGQEMRINMAELYIKIRTYEGNTYVLADSEWDWLIREEEKVE